MTEKYQKMTAAILLLFLWLCPAFGESPFTDTRFQGVYTTENLDRILEAYDLKDGWYWTTQASVSQTFCGQEGKPGWTDTSVNVFGKTGFEKGWYGCRWGKEQVNPQHPNDAGKGECYGFAQFIGYLLSGDRNPHGNWKAFSSPAKAGGLKAGDIVRADYEMDGKRYRHSAVVYSVEEDTVLFLQASGGNFNLMRIRRGFTDGYLKNETSMKALRRLNGIRVLRSPDNE